MCKGPRAAVSSQLAALPTLAELGTSRQSANAQGRYAMKEWVGAQAQGAVSQLLRGSGLRTVHIKCLQARSQQLPSIRQPDLASKNSEQPINFVFQIMNNFFLATRSPGKDHE